ncbi:Scr1 family TA system antitoxin-like transcriptional regulator [Streptomyces sp. NPDC001107]
MEGALKLMQFADAPSLVHFEGPGTGRLKDDPAAVARLRFRFDLLAACALSREKSLALMEALAQDHIHEEHP